MNIKRTYLSHAVAAAFFFSTAAANPAVAVNEVEPNNSILTAQRLFFGAPSLDIQAIMGVESAQNPAQPDVDFFSFEAQAGDKLSLDIDFGMKKDASKRSVDTTIAIFGPLPDVRMKRESRNVDGRKPLDPDSVHHGDALIPDFFVQTTGTYVVGVSSHPRFFVDGGGTMNNTVDGVAFPNGTYTLRISGVTPMERLISIEIKPGSDGYAPVNLKARKAKGNIPVALLSAPKTESSPAFEAMKIKPESLTFGSTGYEKSLLRCGKEGEDINADGHLDLICHFDNGLADWQPDDTEGTVRGLTQDGTQFKGSGMLKIVPKTE